MSYDICYDRCFLRSEMGITPMWLVGSSNCTENIYGLDGKWHERLERHWSPLCNLAGALVAIGNFFLLGWTVSKAVEQGKPEEAAKRVKASASFRMLGMAIICVIFIGVLKTDPYATLIPLLFPRIGLLFRPAIDK